MIRLRLFDTILRMESGGLQDAQFKGIMNHASRFFSVEAVALPSLPQTFRGHERSKRGYAASRLLL